MLFDIVGNAVAIVGDILWHGCQLGRQQASAMSCRDTGETGLTMSRNCWSVLDILNIDNATEARFWMDVKVYRFVGLQVDGATAEEGGAPPNKARANLLAEIKSVRYPPLSLAQAELVLRIHWPYAVLLCFSSRLALSLSLPLRG